MIHVTTRSRNQTTSKRSPRCDDNVFTALPIDPQKQVVLHDDLRHRWERIVAGGRA